jgi:hypothetical protein
MAKIKGGIGTTFSGKAGGMIFSEWKGIPVMRAAFSRGKNSWSEKQVMHRQRFKAINEYCRKCKYTLIPQIWNLAAKNRHGYNLFVKYNSPAFALDGELTAVDKLHFSAGVLPFPQQITAKRKDDDASKVEVSWTNDEHLSQVYAHDELMVVCAYPDRFTDPVATGALRKTGSALIDLPANPENITGIWLFFRAYKKDGYSGDQYFGI